MNNSTEQREAPSILLLNPWIYDFAAYDLWLKPVGLLYLAGYLAQQGFAVSFIDCLDRGDPVLLEYQGLTAPRHKWFGTGKYLRRELPKPPVYRDFPARYCCYGIPEDLFRVKLQALPTPAVVLVTSMMTYWYPGVVRAIELVRQQFPTASVLLGGVYATLCTTHAQRVSGADEVLTTRDPAHIARRLRELIGAAGNPIDESDPPNPARIFMTAPAYHLYPRLDYACLLTSLGCPYRCTYCASQVLAPDFVQRSPQAVFAELHALYDERGVRHFAFYDDALLVNAPRHLMPFLEQVLAARLACTFHTPNGLHARYITKELAELMFRAGFQTVRLSLETTDAARQYATGGKVTGEEFQHAVEMLQRAGFHGAQLGAYIFVGLPGQDLAETRATLEYVHHLGILAHLCEYSPIPATPDWEAFARQGLVSPDDDPLRHNNSVFLYLQERHTFEAIQILKDLLKTFNQQIKAPPQYVCPRN